MKLHSTPDRLYQGDRCHPDITAWTPHTLLLPAHAMQGSLPSRIMTNDVLQAESITCISRSATWSQTLHMKLGQDFGFYLMSSSL